MSEQAVYARLSTIPGLGSRVYPMVLPQNVVYPAATFQRITTTRYYTFRRTRPKAVEPTIQVDIYGHREQGWSVFDTTVDTVRTALESDKSTFIDAERDDYENDTQLFRKSFDVRAWYEED